MGDVGHVHQDHPRVGGEHKCTADAEQTEAGSPPRGRGAPGAGRGLEFARRTTPASAGSTITAVGSIGCPGCRPGNSQAVLRLHSVTVGPARRSVPDRGWTSAEDDAGRVGHQAMSLIGLDVRADVVEVHGCRDQVPARQPRGRGHTHCRENASQRVTMQKGCPAGSVRTRALSPCGW